MENVDEILNHKYNKVFLVDKFVIVYIYIGKLKSQHLELLIYL